MLRVNNLVGFGAGGVVTPITYEFGSRTYDSSPSNPQTFSGVNIGTAAPGRLVVVFSLTRSAEPTISSATIGGVAATLGNLSFRDGAKCVDAFWAVVPTGTTADVVITWASLESLECSIVVHSLYDAKPTLVDSDTLGDPTLTSGINIPAGGIGIVAGVQNTSPTPTLSGVTEETYSPTGSDDLNTVAGVKISDVPLSPHTFTLGNYDAAIAVSFGPK